MSSSVDDIKRQIMFKPIKNLLSYIHKNTSGSSSGTTIDPVETTEEVLSTEKEATVQGNNRRISGRMSVHKLESNRSIDENDIETQIKSSVMMRRPVVGYDAPNARQCGDDEFGKFQFDVDSDRNEEKPEIRVTDNDKEVTEITEELPVWNDKEDGSNNKIEIRDDDDDDDVIELDKSVEEVLVSDEDEPNFLEYTGNEIIILDESELNNSFSSDLVSVDPLAIDDDYIVPQSPGGRSANPLKAKTDEWIGAADDNTKNVEECCNIDSQFKEETVHSKELKDNNERTSAASAGCIKAVERHAEDEEENPEELRSEGSDSGLGSETSTLHSTINSTVDASESAAAVMSTDEIALSSQPPDNNKPVALQLTTAAAPDDCIALAVNITKSAIQRTTATVTITTPTTTEIKAKTTAVANQPVRSNLKRRLEDSTTLDADATPAAVGSDDTAAASSHVTAAAAQKKPKRSINFNNVQVFYFPRQQGFGCVPSVGGCTLGMAAQHVASKTLTLAEHAAELRRAHRQQLQDVSPRAVGSSSEESEESEEDYLSEGSGSEADGESSGFLQPVSPKQRRALLKAAGVRKIDVSEKSDCRNIRNSREVCGCTCRDFCDPETCACSQAGIKCQVDRAMFPCGCSRDACGNIVGRVEFNPARVRTHYIHTVMRMEMESRHQQKPAPAPVGLHQMSANYYNMQPPPPPSNYSSGYASPAYPPLEQSVAPVYYQQPMTQHYSVSGALPVVPPPPVAYHADTCMEAGLFASAANTAPSYDELMPAYNADNHAALNYNTDDIAAETTISTLAYSSYSNVAPPPSASYLSLNTDIAANNNAVVPLSSFSSCAVPSAPPFGAATTTATYSAAYHSSSGDSVCTLDTDSIVTASSAAGSGISCCLLDSGGGDGSSFISLNSPISSSTRLSVINDLLQHNRNTTAALVAVSSSVAASSDLCNSAGPFVAGAAPLPAKHNSELAAPSTVNGVDVGAANNVLQTAATAIAVSRTSISTAAAGASAVGVDIMALAST